MKQLSFTLKRVKNGEQVYQDHFARSKGEKAHRPGEAQQDGETGHRPQVLQSAAALCGRLVGSHLPELDQNHDEHEDVAQQDQEGEGHRRHVEEGIVLQPAAEKIEGFALQF